MEGVHANEENFALVFELMSGASMTDHLNKGALPI
jgi:hypothetical protein